MGKVISLKEFAFQKAGTDFTPGGKGAHAYDVYCNINKWEAVNGPAMPEQKAPVKEPVKQTNPKGFIPFGEPMPREYTLAGTLDKLKPGKK